MKELVCGELMLKQEGAIKTLSTHNGHRLLIAFTDILYFKISQAVIAFLAADTCVPAGIYSSLVSFEIANACPTTATQLSYYIQDHDL